MSVKDEYLRPMLDAGSSRVFNCNDRYELLLENEVAEPNFFKVAALHGMVIIKEPITDRKPRRGPMLRAIGTKLYLPYNTKDIYEGGRSVFLHDPKLMNALNELCGLQGPHTTKEQIRDDTKLLKVLDSLPSLDAFLMRDALELEGIAANELYFDVGEAERAAIFSFIRRKFEPLVRAALSGSAGDPAALAKKVSSLVDKIWEAKDLQALDPLIAAFRFPRHDALAIFAAWKGINFYTFEYERSRRDREALDSWLRDKAPAVSARSRDMAAHLEELRHGVIARFRANWKTVDDITNDYDRLYESFVSNPEAVAGFIDFLRMSKEIYWRLGDALSKTNHAIHCWRKCCAGFLDGVLPPDDTAHLLSCLQLILAEEKPPDSEINWNVKFG